MALWIKLTYMQSNLSPCVFIEEKNCSEKSRWESWKKYIMERCECRAPEFLFCMLLHIFWDYWAREWLMNTMFLERHSDSCMPVGWEREKVMIMRIEMRVVTLWSIVKYYSTWPKIIKMLIQNNYRTLIIVFFKSMKLINI